MDHTSKSKQTQTIWFCDQDVRKTLGQHPALLSARTYFSKSRKPECKNPEIHHCQLRNKRQRFLFLPHADLFRLIPQHLKKRFNPNTGEIFNPPKGRCWRTSE